MAYSTKAQMNLPKALANRSVAAEIIARANFSVTADMSGTATTTTLEAKVNSILANLRVIASG